MQDVSRNAEIAQENFERAQRHFEQARAAVDEFGVRSSDRLSEFPGAEGVRRDMLLDTLKYYHQFAQDAGNDPNLRQETALAHFRSAVIAAKLGAVDDAIREYKAAQQLLQETLGANGTGVDLRGQLALSHNNLGLLYAGRSDWKSARSEYESAIAIQTELVAKQRDDAALASQLAESQANLGLLLDQVGDAAGAERSLRSAVAVLRGVFDAQGTHAKSAHDLAIAYNDLSFVLRSRDAEAAEQASREAIAALEHAPRQGEPGDEYQDDLALCYNNLATLESQKGDWREAIASHERAIDLQTQLARKSPAVVRHRSDLAISLNNLGVACCRAGESAKADEAFHRARDLFSQLAEDYPDELSYRSSLAAQLNNQALALAGMGRHGEAIEIYPSAIESQRVCQQRIPKSDLMRDVLSKMYYNFGQSLRAERRWSEAEQTALSRRELWNGNGERLLSVAAELADLRAAMLLDDGHDNAAVARSVDREVLSTLQHSYDRGWPQAVDLNKDKQFAGIRQNAEYAAKVAELSQQSQPSTGSDEHRGGVPADGSN